MQEPSKIQAWWRAARPWTLRAAALPVCVGTALALQQGSFKLFPALCCLAFSVLAQILANYANDYYDHLKGADNEERRGPPRAVASGWIKPRSMLRGTYCVAFLAFLSGLPLVAYGGWPLLAVGALALLSAWAYTAGPFPLGYKGLGDLAVYVFFGWVAVGFTYYVQAGAWTLDAFLAGTGIGALANNILIVTSARDREPDARANKKTLVVRFGAQAVANQYKVNLVIAGLSACWLTWRGAHPVCLLAALVLPMAWPVGKNLPEFEQLQVFIQATRRTARSFLIYGLLLSLGLLI